MNRTILDMNRTAIATSGMPKGEWDKVSKHSAYSCTKNRIPHKSLGGKTPVEIIFSKDARMERQNLRPFRQKVTCYNYEATDKLLPRSYEGQLVGYTETHSTYWIKDQTGKSRLAKSPKPIQNDQTSSEDSSSDEWDVPTSENQPSPTTPTPQAALDTILTEMSTSIVPSLELPNEQETYTPALKVKKERKKKDTAYWDKTVGKREKSTREPKPRVLAIGTDPDHPTDEQARNSPQAVEWTKARKAEREQLVRYGVFTKIKKSDIPDGIKIADTKWVYTVKRKPDGGILKYKARKVRRGFSQEAGKSYDSDQTFAQMMRPETFKILLAIALHLGWKVRQWHVVAAYLQAPLHYQVYVSNVNETGKQNIGCSIRRYMD